MYEYSQNPRIILYDGSIYLLLCFCNVVYLMYENKKINN